MATGGHGKNIDLECLKSNEFLRSLECRYGLVDHLHQFLSQEIEQDLKYRRKYECKEELLKHIHPSNIEGFKNALRETHQTHLANFITYNGSLLAFNSVGKQQDDEEWPSSLFDIKPIKNVYRSLVESIHTKSAVDELYSARCISRDHKIAIQAENDSHEKNRKLLDIMECRSIGNLRKFVQYVEDNHPKILETRGVFYTDGNQRDGDERLTSLSDIKSKKSKDSPVPLGKHLCSAVDQLHVDDRPRRQHKEAIPAKGANRRDDDERPTNNNNMAPRLNSHSTSEILENNENDKSISGVTVVGEEIFVVRAGQSQVNAYDSHSLRASRDINIPDMTSPWGLAGCAYNKAVYISESWLNKFIHRVDLTNNSVTRWEMRENHKPRGLSVTAEHTLLVTVQIISGTRGESRESRAVEYTSEGQQVREIRFVRSIEWAWHTVQLSSDQFIVCHGLSSSLNRVCVINAEGQIIKSFGREEGEGEDQLNEPRSLAIDENSKHVFVADMLNRRVLMLDSELMTRLGEVHVPRDLSSPTRLYFDSSTDRLFVAELSYARLFVVTRPELRN